MFKDFHVSAEITGLNDRVYAYMEYIGEDFAADMAKMAEDPMTQLWWKETDPCQEPVATAGEDVWWADMEEVFHTN